MSEGGPYRATKATRSPARALSFFVPGLQLLWVPLLVIALYAANKVELRPPKVTEGIFECTRFDGRDYNPAKQPGCRCRASLPDGSTTEGVACASAVEELRARAKLPGTTTIHSHDFKTTVALDEAAAQLAACVRGEEQCTVILRLRRVEPVPIAPTELVPDRLAPYLVCAALLAVFLLVVSSRVVRVTVDATTGELRVCRSSAFGPAQEVERALRDIFEVVETKRGLACVLCDGSLMSVVEGDSRPHFLRARTLERLRALIAEATQP
jgi:hypothetical protein